MKKGFGKGGHRSHVTTSKNTFLLLVAYVPPEKKEQLEGLLSILDHCKDYQHIIITGDLNSKSME